MNSEEDVIVEDDGESERGEDALRKLREKLKACEGEKQEYLDGWQRSRADFVNAQRRFEDEVSTAKERGATEVLERLLSVLDSFEQALQHATLNENEKKGIDMIYKQLANVLSVSQVVSFSPLGETFDPMRHEAIGYDTGGEEGKVSTVVRTGYERKGVLIRPAAVRVFGGS